MSSRFLRASLLTAVFSMILGVSSLASAGQSSTAREPARPVATSPNEPTRATNPVPSAGEPSRDSQYANREAKSPQAAKFKGGESMGIYIGGSTVALVLAIVLLIVLL